MVVAVVAVLVAGTIGFHETLDESWLQSLYRAVVSASLTGLDTVPRSDGAKVVLFSSIRGFKGLESPAVVLCELDNVADDARDQQLYVGLSRARNHCVVVAPPAAG